MHSSRRFQLRTSRSSGQARVNWLPRARRNVASSGRQDLLTNELQQAMSAKQHKPVLAKVASSRSCGSFGQLPRQRSACSGPAGKRGFTLLEMLLAIGLTGLLLAGLYGVLRFQTRAADQSTRRIERVQLARTLLELMAEDIRASVPPYQAWNKGRRLDRTVAFNLGISGSADQLVVSPHRPPGYAQQRAKSVDELTEPELGPNATLPGTATPAGDLFAGQHATANYSTLAFWDKFDQGPPPAGFTQVVYTVLRSPETGQSPLGGVSGTGFGQPNMPGGNQSRMSGGRSERSGLARIELTTVEQAGQSGRWIRRKMQWDCPCGCGDPTCLCPTCGVIKVLMGRATGSEGDSFSETELALASQVQVLAPEVVELRFRYYGKNGWTSQWDSSRGLPAAVEIRLGIDMTEETPSGPAAEQNEQAEQQVVTYEVDWEGTEVTGTSEAAGTGSGKASGPEVEYFTLLVRVPAGPIVEPVPSEALPSFVPAPVVPVPLVPAPQQGSTGHGQTCDCLKGR